MSFKLTLIKESKPQFEMYIEATVRGYHAYFDNASVRIGEILTCEMELDNPHDKYERWKPGCTCTKVIIKALS